MPMAFPICRSENPASLASVIKALGTLFLKYFSKVFHDYEQRLAIIGQKEKDELHV